MALINLTPNLCPASVPPGCISRYYVERRYTGFYYLVQSYGDGERYAGECIVMFGTAQNIADRIAHDLPGVPVEWTVREHPV